MAAETTHPLAAAIPCEGNPFIEMKLHTSSRQARKTNRKEKWFTKSHSETKKCNTRDHQKKTPEVGFDPTAACLEGKRSSD